MSQQDDLVVHLTEGEMEQSAGCSACTYNHSAQEAETGDLRVRGQTGWATQGVPGQPELHSETCLENNRKEIGIWKAEKDQSQGLWNGNVRGSRVLGAMSHGSQREEEMAGWGQHPSPPPLR